MRVGSSSIIASLMLAVLTLVVFGTLRDFGPESVVRRFHEAAIAGDFDELRRISSPANSQSTTILAERIKALHQAGARIGYPQIQTNRDGSVVAKFNYATADRVVFVFWVLRRQPLGWRVMTDETLRLRV